AKMKKSVIDESELLEKIHRALVYRVAKLLEVKVEDIHGESAFEKFGFDSISFTDFCNQLNKQYQLEMMPTIFFEYPTLNAFAHYLAGEHQTQLAEYFQLHTSPVASAETFVESLSDQEESTETAVMEAPFVTRPLRLLANNTQRSTTPLASPAPADGIAIIGMSGKFPMAEDIASLWDNLIAGQDCISEIPADRWDWRSCYGDPLEGDNQTKIKWGGFIDGIREFDPLFFGISPREAEWMDPQQRLLMTYIWHAIEDAGYSAGSLAGKNIGIFVATDGSSGYAGLIERAGLAQDNASVTGLVPSMGPSRMSYFLNIHGPSEPIETACSSSLVAIHRAVQAMASGSCEMAIVGGINIILTPKAHIGFSLIGALSAEGRCKAFSSQANGFALSEGVGMLVLKKLPQAQNSGDHIYGVIRGTAENHGGRASSFTAPNPVAQAELLKAAYRQAGIDPRSVSYIETHGTGTKLGDPTEINGLKAAFQDLYRGTGNSSAQAPHCGLGSIKTNIGHTVLAAGVASVIKVLLQLKHKTLVKTLHCEQINPYIQLKDSPFYIVQKQQAWHCLQDTQGHDLPRRAGVSSFGMGGVNAHVVIEEYRAESSSVASARLPDKQLLGKTGSQLIVLSAKNDERLKEAVNNLYRYLTEHVSLLADDLQSIAYTLQTGREAMDERLGLMVKSTEELQEKLQAFLDGEENNETLYRGQVKRNKDTLAVFTADGDLQKAMDAWISKGKYNKLLDFWVKGLIFDWDKLYGEDKPRRISLPTYPFAKQQYWVPEGKGLKTEHKAITRSILHPLVHENTSSLSEQRFSSTFTGEEFFLKDHKVQGEKVLPGVAYLEMARAAMVQAAEGTSAQLNPDRQQLQLSNVVWVRPIRVNGEAQRVHISLFPEANNTVAYEVYIEDTSLDVDDAVVVHSQGIASFLAENQSLAALDLAQLQSRMTQETLTAEQCYETFKAMGLEYGVAHQGIEEIAIGQQEALAKLSLPASVAAGFEQYTLHPSLLDAALQASIGLADQSNSKAALPFALENLEILSPCTSTMWAWVRYAKGSSASDKIQKLDIDLCDDDGRICVRLKSFCSRVLESNVLSSSPGEVGTLMLKPVWQEKAVEKLTKLTHYAGHRVFLCGFSSLHQALEKHLPQVVLIDLESAATDLASRFNDAALQLFGILQQLVKEKPKEPVLIQVLVSNEGSEQVYASLSSLLKTAQLENPKIVGQVIVVEANASVDTVSQRLEENSCSPQETQVRYEQNTRLVASFEECIPPQKRPDNPWKASGVYLITGGAGGLGLIFSQAIAEQAEKPTLILTGRSALDNDKQEKLETLRALGANVAYQQVDVTDKQVVHSLIQTIQQDYGPLNGVLHSAGVNNDNFILKKTPAEFARVLAPKVAGTVNLDEASQAIDLDFFVLFSSLAGSFGNVGQADYATANGFMDAYAHYRNDLVATQQRYGQSLSINWPLWKEGGMGVDATAEQLMKTATGMVAMQSAKGINALVQSLSSSVSQVLVMVGQLKRMKQHLLSGTEKPLPSTQPPTPAQARTVIDTDTLFSKLQNVLLQKAAELLKIRVEDLDADTELNEYGFDSISLTEFINQLNQRYQLTLAPTIFFEYPTIETFAHYLSESHQAVFTNEFNLQGQDQQRIEREDVKDKKQHLSSGTEKSLPSTQPPTPVQVRTVIDTDTLFGKLQNVLLQKAAELLKIRVEDLDTDTELNEYGFDSISLTEFINQLNQRYQLTLAPTIFFEYPTIETFAHYLSESHQAVFANEFNLQGQDQQRIEREDVKDKDWVVEHKPRHRFAKASILPSLSTKKSEAIAIIGMSGKFPQADNLEIFWQNLQAGKDCISEIPPSRWNWQSLYGDPYTEVNKTNIKWGGFIDGVDEFDPLFFGISPREAQLIDPQQRLLMAYVWQVIEDAGYSAESLSGTQTGIFIGTGSSGYSSLISQADIPIEGYSATGMVPSVGPNRMSYLLNLHGPSEPIETACSSSLVAIHRAVQTIEAGDCEMAIVGGINIIITPQAHISFNKAGMLCEDGRCKTFSDKANGYVRGEGVGMLFLKKLSIAEQDRDHIYGVIRGSAENHGGRANSLTAPNPKAQADLLQTAYKKAGIDPRTVSYIETHGTGTALGDPIEINGLKSAFDALYKQTGDTNITQAHCGLGSVKSNIGHLELAAGVAGVIKVLLQLKHCIRVKSLHCDKINPYIELKDSPFYIVQENQDWPALKDAQGQTLPRRAGVSSFGFGGVNAHVVIEEYCPQPSHESDLTKDRGTVPPFIMVLSGKNQERLQVYAQKLLNFIQNDDAIDLANIAYTLQVGRKAMEERLGLIVNTQEELQEKLQVFLDGKESIEDLYRGQVKRNKDALAVFSADEDMAKIIDIWINKGKYHKLLDLWVKGLIFDWNKLKCSREARDVIDSLYRHAEQGPRR
ncbi:MAG: SDR family NAD(P)-dependent oxidoreductase, partial [Pseudomonadales bacterium]